MTEWTAEQQREHRKLWVEALRSGKYEQATQRLRKGDAMCCLGVACELSGLGRWDTDDTYRTPADFNRRVLPRPVRDWLGLDRMDSSYVGGQLSEKNDAGATFAEIADIIESEPAGLIATPKPVEA